MAGSITLSGLEARHKIPEGYLDERCTDEHIVIIATFLKSWNLVAHHLGLSEQQVEAIERDSRNEEERRLKCLMRWKEKDSFKATYRKLLQVLLLLDYGDTADKVCEKVVCTQKTCGEEVKKKPIKENKAPFSSERGSSVVDGNVVYFSSLEDVYAYNTSSRKWSALPKSPQWGGCLAVVKGLLTYIGGVQISDSKRTNKLVSLSTKLLSRKKWKEIYPPMPTCRSRIAATTYENKVACYLIVAGGTSTGRHADILNTVEVLDVDTLVWSIAASLPHPLSFATITVRNHNYFRPVCDGDEDYDPLDDDCIFILGGNDRERKCRTAFWCKVPQLIASCTKDTSNYGDQQAENVWQQTVDMPVYYSTCATLKWEILAVGGSDQDLKQDQDSKKTSAVYKYNLYSESWDVISHLSMARAACYVAALNTNQLLVVGGHVGERIEVTDSYEIVDISQGR